MAQQFDASSKLFIKWSVQDWLALVGVEAPGQVIEIDSDVSSISARVDKILQVELPIRYLEHLEIQSQHDPKIPVRLCRYGALIHYQQQLPVISSVILLTPAADGPGLTGLYEMRDPNGEVRLQYRYRVIRLWEIPALQLCDAGIGVLGLAPLGKINQGELPEVIQRMRIRTNTELKPTDQQDFWGATALLMGLRHSSKIIREVLMSPVYLEDSSIGRMWIEKGRREEAAKTLLRLLEFRFGDVTSELQTRINAIIDLALLEELHLMTLKASSVHEVAAEIQSRSGKST